MRILCGLVCVALLVGPRAEAKPHPPAPPISADPDSDLARQHFRTGSELYSEGRFAEALAEFEHARSLKPLPAFEYNIARCLDRLERWLEAAAAYRRYVATAPGDPQAPELTARAELLERRAAPRVPAQPAPSPGPAVATANVIAAPAPAAPPRSRWRLAVGLGVGLGAAAMLGVTLGLVLAAPRNPDPSLGTVTW